MPARRGGEAVEGVKRGNRFERVNVTGAVCGGEHFAVGCYQRAADSRFFENWFKEHLLGETPKGCTAIMDNAGFHRKKVLRKIARGKARLLFLPPHSPDYNPIEKSWANMKRFLCNNMRDFKSVGSAVYHYFGIPDN